MASLQETVQTGLTYRPPIPGIVPEMEEREAARFVLTTWTEWRALPRTERVAAVAHFRLSRLIDLHGHDAVQRELRTRARRAKR